MSSIEIIDLSSGSDYTSAPTVSFTGGEGTGATATATIAPLGQQAITWDVENRPVTIGSATYVYDGNGQRVMKTENGETILYVNRYYEKNLTTATVTVQYYLGGRLVAEMEGEELRFFHQDILNSTSLVTDSSGSSLGSTSHYPFGSNRSGSVPTDEQFTGQKLDSTGLYYYNARYYDPTVGRFISADTIIPNFTNPQSLNRYSYCYNNPLKYTDPTGHWGWAILGAIGAVINTTVHIIKHHDNLTVGGVLTAAAVGFGSGAVGNFGPIVGTLTGMYSTVVNNIIDEEETSLVDLAIGGLGGFAGGQAGINTARAFVDDSVEEVGTFSQIMKSSTMEATETGVKVTTNTTIVTGSILTITPATQTAMYSIVQGSVGSLVEQGIDYGLLRVSRQTESESYYMNRTRGLLLDADW